ncbi:MAG: nitrous oxide reductase family maturation protein NosD [Myxococcales bacterium]|nr:nitrous oxide reductase family maturation protein NosD [Myxococcales bacterium]
MATGTLSACGALVPPTRASFRVSAAKGADVARRPPRLGFCARRRALALWAIALALPASARADVLRPASGEELVNTIARANEGDVVEVPPGTWRGGLRIDKRITLRGAGGVIDGGGRGQVITVLAAGARLEGLVVRGSGFDLGAFDACVWTAPSAEGVEVVDNRLSECAFGIYVQESDGAQIVGNHVAGRREVREPDRGNGVHFHDAQRVLIRGNHVEHTRDGLFIGATHDSVIEDNHIRRTRYGVHYMWSHRNQIRRNVVRESLAGYALMQSHFLEVEENVALRNRRAGMLLRDGQDNTLRGNVLAENGQGLFVYNSLRERLEENVVVHNGVGAKLWGALMVEDVFSANDFVGNSRQILYVGRRDLVWGDETDGNHYSDYLGWDQDDDGLGDRPYRVDAWSGALTERHPVVVLLMRSPALELLSHLEQRLPMLRTFTVIDRAPRMRASPRLRPAMERIRELGGGLGRVAQPMDSSDRFAH